jgi:hypothetical protein
MLPFFTCPFLHLALYYTLITYNLHVGNHIATIPTYLLPNTNTGKIGQHVSYLTGHDKLTTPTWSTKYPPFHPANYQRVKSTQLIKHHCRHRPHAHILPHHMCKNKSSIPTNTTKLRGVTVCHGYFSIKSLFSGLSRA